MSARNVLCAIALSAQLLSLLSAAPAPGLSGLQRPDRSRPRAAFTVDSTLDAVDASPGDGLCATAAGECTLRAAIQETNSLVGFDTITLPAGAYTLTIPGAGEDAAATGDLDLRGNLSLTGAGMGVTTVDGNGLATGDRVLHIVPASAVVALAGLTITNGHPADNGGGIANHGRLTLSNSQILGNTAAGVGYGGGVYSTGPLTISRSSISRNTAEFGFAFGGGLYTTDLMTITNSTISRNTAYYGGGLANAAFVGSAVTIVNSTLADNRGTFGGGIFKDDSVTIQNSTFSGNRARFGGGIENNLGLLTVDRSHFFDNRAAGGTGGAIHNRCCIGGTITILNSTIARNSAPTGGGIDMGGAALIIQNSTISQNFANFQGGGIRTSGGSTVTLSSVTITLNSAGSMGGGIEGFDNVTLRNTILAANTATAGAPDCSAQLFSAGYNLLGDNTGCTFTSGEGDQIGTGDNPIDPLLGPLQDNGGSTWTHALLVGSPAIEGGNPTGCTDDQGDLLLTDQRGFERHVDGDGDGSAICDIGAYEFGAGP